VIPSSLKLAWTVHVSSSGNILLYYERRVCVLETMNGAQHAAEGLKAGDQDTDFSFQGSQ
jgi:hypothetical protein